MPDLTKQEELKGLLQEVMGGQISDAVTASEERQEERIKSIEQMCSEQKDMMEQLLAQPARKMDLQVPAGGIVPVIHRGYALHKQGENVFGRPLIEVMGEEKKERYSKFLIDLISAKVGGDPQAMQALADQKAAMQEGTTTEGGFIVPDEFTDEILAFARLNSFALQDCRIWPMSTDVRRIPAEDGAVSVAWTAEESDATQSEPTLAEVVLTATRLDAFSIASNELLQDANVDVVSWLTELFSEAIGQELDNQVLNGTGSPCSGVLTAQAGASVVLGSGEVSFSSVNADDLSDAIAQLPVNRLAGAKFYMHRTILHHVRILKDTANNYIWSAPSQADPAMIWGMPYSISEKAPTSTDATQASKGFIVLGNMRYFALGRRLQSMTLDIDPYTLFKSYQSQFRIVNRWGMSTGLAGGFVRAVSAAS